VRFVTNPVSRIEYHMQTSPNMTLDWTHGGLAEGLRDYNAARFFEAHEAWESVWLTARQQEKLFLQSLIQTTVAMHHFSRGNLLGASRLLTAALRKLGSYPPEFAKIDVSLLRDDILACLELLGSIPPPTQLTPPRIHLLSL